VIWQVRLLHKRDLRFSLFTSR